MPKVGIVGAFAASLEGAIRRNLTIPCQIIVSDEAGTISRLADIDVLVTIVLTCEIARACTRLKLVQVPGAGLDPPLSRFAECADDASRRGLD